ncbi:hypothetical protein QBC33DRAFT_337494 [Phialemonium atrogriseum]|uniref:Zn(2)-C6 fungal-type domain-containing protein n=1 Tax=Phialemonium atrogriseum TaxID=1093897 RepID=A0AAJ0FC14_9PEZI|nr:uncharacterized protein QBC33DRAFT_337494 [Phialemonium atrogriseum]KAK1761667.1 hypothetical protein QBC33DRAFT_337494 [Phialemonium atrogriseum]
MVYRGKPSTACEICRWKRRKCDQGRPACGQCIRGMVACPGYRDLSGLAIHNETKDVIRKAKASNTRRRASGLDPSEGPDSHTSLPSSTSPDPPNGLDVAAPPSQLSTSLQDVAVSHFVLAYAPSGQFGYLPDLVDPDVLNAAAAISGTVQGKVTTPLPRAILACSLATLSLTPAYSSRAILSIAYKTYNTAIASLNVALSIPATSALDDTLLSVLLLGLFEAVLFRGRKSPTSWTAHTHGALALVNMRGIEQFRTDLGRKMFLHASQNIRGSCAQMSIDPPRELMELQDLAIAQKLLDLRREVGPRIGVAMEKMASMRAKVIRLGGFSSPRSRSIIMNALEQDDEVTSIIRDAMGNQKIVADYPVLVRHQRVHPRLARIVMILHSVRLLFNTFAYRSLTESPRCGCHVEDNRTVTDDMDHLGCLTENQERTVLQLVTLHGNEAVREILGHVAFFTGRHSQAYLQRYLIWPLSVMAVSPLAAQSARGLALDHLHGIGRQFGLGQAEQAAQMVEEARPMEDWLHVHILS